MKFTIKSKERENISTLSRKIGYQYLGQDKERKEISFIRPIGGGRYPRFHLYLKSELNVEELLFNLHLDQKKPVYEGATAHSGEYESDLVKQEAERITRILQE